MASTFIDQYNIGTSLAKLYLSKALTLRPRAVNRQRPVTSLRRIHSWYAASVSTCCKYALYNSWSGKIQTRTEKRNEQRARVNSAIMSHTKIAYQPCRFPIIAYHAFYSEFNNKYYSKCFLKVTIKSKYTNRKPWPSVVTMM